MYIRHVRIRHFRGIASLDWTVLTRLVCLVGPGDSTKTTVLDAIGYALSPRWSLPLHDADFHNGDTSRPIEIEVTITELPQQLLAEDKYGLYLRGWSAAEGIHDDPGAQDEAALTIRLCVDASMEPTWAVVKDALRTKPIKAVDRAALALFRVDDNVDQHLGWGRGSALAALTGDVSTVPVILTDAHRQARAAVFDRANSHLQGAATVAQAAAVALGVAPRGSFRPGLDPRPTGRAGLILHDGDIPVAAAGLGSRRLVALALQRAQVQAGSVVVVDEVEHGLEPHRLAHLLAKLREAVTAAGVPDAEAADAGAGGGVDPPRYGQVLMTTHSPVTVTELRIQDLHVVRAQGGVVTIRQVPEAVDTVAQSDAQGTVRAGPAALLARRVVVGEGATEVGLCRGLADRWATARRVPLAHLGTAITNGGGDTAVRRAQCFAELGYPTALLLDSDTSIDTAEAEAAGVRVLRWEGQVALEERIALDLPEEALGELVALAVAESTADSDGDSAPILAAIAERLPGKPRLTNTDPSSWTSPTCTLQDIRQAIGKAAKKAGWFKRQDHGEALGRFVAQMLPRCAGTDLATKLAQLERFAYDDPEPDAAPDAISDAIPDGVRDAAEPDEPVTVDAG